MAGHSKWANIKRTKAKVDAERGKAFSRLVKDIMSAARQGGGSPEANVRLRLAIDKARAANMPHDNIQRAIAKATGQMEGQRIEEVIYEGYGPGGVAVMMEIATDNRNRTAADVRAYFNKYGGNLGETGSVAWMFDRKGVVQIERGQGAVSEDRVLAIALEAGAEDLKSEPDLFEVITDPADLDAVINAVAAAGLAIEQAELQLLPKTTVLVAGETAENLLKLLEALDEHDDVQHVYSNFDLPEGDMTAPAE